MELYGLEIFRDDFRFHITDNGSESFFVFYNDERLTVKCTCPSGDKCSHTAFVHELINNTTNAALLSFLREKREGNSQAISSSTVLRMRGAFAREYNLANGIVQYPDPSPRGPRAPLGWEGKVPGVNVPMRVIERTAATFTVYEVDSDTWKLVVGIADPTCQAEKCRRGCKHEKAVMEAFREWRARGWIPNTGDNKPATKPITLTYDDLRMVERVEPYQRSFAPGTNLTVQDVRGLWRSLTDNTIGELWDATIQNTTASGYSAGIDEAKFKEDIEKAKELLEKKEKPAKPRTRFTDLEL